MQPYEKSNGLHGEIYLAGECVPPGVYRQIGGLRELRFEQADYLPASFDGRVACYERVENTWAQISQQRQQAQDPPRVPMYPR